MYSHNSASLKNNSEISFVDLLIFVKQFWFIFIITTIAGLSISIVYLMTVPYQYQAEAKIKILRIPVPDSRFGAKIEDVGDVAERFFEGQKFDDNVLNACTVPGGIEKNNLLKSIKITSINGSSDYFKLTVTLANRSIARSCAENIGNWILKNEQTLVDAVVDGIRARSKILELRLSQDRILLSSLNVKNSATVQTYLDLIIKIRELEDQIYNFEKIIIDSKNINSFKFSVNIINNLIYKKIIITLIFGLACGFFIGFLIALCQKFYFNSKS